MTPCACTRTCDCPELQRMEAEAVRLFALITHDENGQPRPWGCIERIEYRQRYDSQRGRIQAHRAGARTAGA